MRTIIRKHKKHRHCGRLPALCLALILALAPLTGCGSRKGASPEEHGLALIGLMAELAENGAGDLYTNDAAMRDYIDTFGDGDYRKAEHIYRVDGKAKSMWEYIEDQGSSLDRSSLSAAAGEYFARRIFLSLPQQIIARYGATMLAASSVLTTGDCFVNRDVKESMLLLYTFDDGLPCIVVFTPGEDGAVSAAAYVIFDEGFDDDELEDCLDGMGLDLKVGKVK